MCSNVRVFAEPLAVLRIPPKVAIYRAPCSMAAFVQCPSNIMLKFIALISLIWILKPKGFRQFINAHYGSMIRGAVLYESVFGHLAGRSVHVIHIGRVKSLFRGVPSLTDIKAPAAKGV